MKQLEGIWIPKETLYTDLSGIEKIVMAEILALSKQCQCTMSNRQMGEYLQFSQRQISRAIKKLIKRGLIIAEYPTTTTRILTPTQIGTPTEINTTQIGTPTKIGIGTPTEIGTPPLPKLVGTPTEIGIQINNNIKEIDSNIYDPLKPFIDFYNNNIEILTPHNLTILQSYVEDYGEEWTMKALEYVAEADRGKRNIKYLGGVLKGWERDGELRPWEKQKCEDTRPDRPYVSDLMKAAGYEYS